MKYEIIDLKQNGDDRGGLIVLEDGGNVPFDIKRAFYIYGTKEEVRRGCHANRLSKFFFVAVNGSCKVLIDDGINATAEIILDAPSKALYLDKMVWKEMFDFSEDAVLLVLSNEKYNSIEYIRDYDEFLKEVK